MAFTETLRSKVLVSCANRYCLSDEFLMDRTDSGGFFSMRTMCTVSDNTYNATDSSLIIVH